MRESAFQYALKSIHKHKPTIYLLFFILSNSIEVEEITFHLQETASKNQVRNFQNANKKLEILSKILCEFWTCKRVLKNLFRDPSTHHSYPLH